MREFNLTAEKLCHLFDLEVGEEGKQTSFDWLSKKNLLKVYWNSSQKKNQTPKTKLPTLVTACLWNRNVRHSACLLFYGPLFCEEHDCLI